jgi:hypothetical protein
MLNFDKFNNLMIVNLLFKNQKTFSPEIIQKQNSDLTK